MQNINLDITPGDFWQVLRFSQGDIGKEFKINVVNYDIPAGATVKCVATKPSGFGFQVAGTVSGNVVTIVSTEDMTSEAGRFPAELRIEKDSVRLGTANFFFEGEKDPHPNSTIDGTPEDPLVYNIDVLCMTAVNNWLDDHPEATTTVQDGSITKAKLATALKNEIEGKAEQTDLASLENEVGVLDARMDTFASLPEGSTSGDAELLDIRVGANGITYPSAGDAVRGQVSDLKSDLSEIDTSSIYQKNYVEGYYLSRQGELVEDSNYCVSEKIPLYTFVNASYYYGTGYDSALKINLCSYKADGTFVDYWGPTSGSESRTISNFGTGASYVRFSYVKGYANAHLGTAVGSVDNIVYWKPTDVVGDIANKTNGEKPKAIQWTSVNSNAVHKLCHNSLRSPKIFVYAKFSSFDAIEVGHGQVGQYTQYFKIDGTNVTFYTHGSEGSSVAHGLTFSEYIGVVIDVAYNNNYKITINTIGGTWSREMEYPNPWQGNKGETFVKNHSSVITYLSIGQTGDYQFSKWMFGDSYLTNYSDARWPYYLNEYDIPYTMINAFPGENSEEAYIDWLDALTHGTPKFAIWCLGMNDPDDGAVNAKWLAVIQMFIADCQKRGITPILATIPNTPSYTHTYKNAWVKSSGYRYIDFAEAVGAESEGSTWYDGCLETGAVRTHPTVEGAKLLFMRAIQDFLEFFQK